MKILQHIGIHCPSEMSHWSSSVDWSIKDIDFSIGASNCFRRGEQSDAFNSVFNSCMCELFSERLLISL